MARRTPTKPVDRAQARSYFEKALGFHGGARAALLLGGSFSANGVAVLCVHAAIAYADAVTVAARGLKSASGEHTDAGEVLAGAVRLQTDADRSALSALRYVLQRKDEVSYTRHLIREEDARRLVEKLDAFAAWASARFEELR